MSNRSLPTPLENRKMFEEAKKTLEKQQKDLEKLIEEIKRYNEKQKTELKKTNPYAVELVA